MLKTLPGDNFAPPDWVPGDVTQFNTLYLDIDTAFKNFGPLFDAYYGEGDAGTFDDIIKGLRDDPNGPRLDVGKDIIGKLGKRVTLLADAKTHRYQQLAHSSRPWKPRKPRRWPMAFVD